MAELSGKTGKIYATPSITATTISFADANPDEIRDSGKGLIDAGFAADDLVTAAGTSNNNGTYQIATVVPATIVLTAAATLAAEGAGSSFSLTVPLPGQVLADFFDWTVSTEAVVLDTTSFDDDGVATAIPGVTSWTATAQKHWTTTNNQNSWLGTIKRVAFFTRYSSTPSVTNAYYYDGDNVISNITPNTPVNALVEQSMSMSGTGALVFTTRTTPWPAVDDA